MGRLGASIRLRSLLKRCNGPAAGVGVTGMGERGAGGEEDRDVAKAAEAAAGGCGGVIKGEELEREWKDGGEEGIGAVALVQLLSSPFRLRRESKSTDAKVGDGGGGSASVVANALGAAAHTAMRKCINHL